MLLDYIGHSRQTYLHPERSACSCSAYHPCTPGSKPARFPVSGEGGWKQQERFWTLFVSCRSEAVTQHEGSRELGTGKCKSTSSADLSGKLFQVAHSLFYLSGYIYLFIPESHQWNINTFHILWHNQKKLATQIKLRTFGMLIGARTEILILLISVTKIPPNGANASFKEKYKIPKPSTKSSSKRKSLGFAACLTKQKPWSDDTGL